MKKIMMIAAMMVAAVTANAQNEVGQITLKPTVGLNIATMTKIDGSKVRPGFLVSLPVLKVSMVYLRTLVSLLEFSTHSRV